MCPLWPLHIVFFYLLSLVPVWVICQSAPKNLMAEFGTNTLQIHMEDKVSANITIKNMQDFKEGDMLQIYSDSDHIASTDFKTYELQSSDVTQQQLFKAFNMHGNFLGKTRVRAKICDKNEECSVSNTDLSIVVIREERIIDKIFTGSVATLVSLIYINFGCALDWDTVKATVRKPIGPVIGFFTQFLFMPLISYGSGLLLFPDDYEMQLGMFFTGVSPGGGASNIWTYVLGGNLNLSITMTTISTFAAFGMMPLWIFTLGSRIFKFNDMGIPYGRIAGFAIGLIIPLGLGFVIQRYFPKIAKFLVRMLKMFLAFLLVFIIVFATITNLYLFELFSWRIIVAGMCIPWLGYMVGWLAAFLFKQPSGDCLAIALETGIQNSGIAIFLLRFSLSQPEADLTTVIPVSISIMTPLPMICIYIYQLIKKRYTKNQNHTYDQYEPLRVVRRSSKTSFEEITVGHVGSTAALAENK